MGAGEAAHFKGDRNGAGVATEQVADVCAAELPLSAAAKQVGKHPVFGDEDRGAALWWYARVGEVVQALVVVAEDGDCDLEEFGGVAFVTEHGGDCVGRYRGVGHESIGEKLDGSAVGDAPQDPAFAAVNGGGVVDELTVLELAVGIGRDEVVFVKGFPWSFDGTDG